MSMWDLVQRAQIRALQGSQGLADSEHLARSRRQDERADSIEDQLAKVTDLVEALCDLVTERLGLDDDDFAAALTSVIDRRQEAMKPVRCACGAAVLRSEVRCQYCGAERPPDDVRAGPPTTF
jgi:hypothetical protein